ncbi:MAG: Ig-like domain-containing protein [bacterium]
MRVCSTAILCLMMFTQVRGQNDWNPDSTAYNYLSRGTNLQNWVASAGTRIEIDRTIYRTAGGAVKWTILPNSGVVTLDLQLVDIDLRGRVLYTTCRRDNNAATIVANLYVASGKGFRLYEPVHWNDSGKHLPPQAWHRRGASLELTPFGGAVAHDLAHAQRISFRALNASVEQNLWIDEIKYIRPRGPACVIHFNHYRNTADSLLTPWLLARGYPANLDFTYDLAFSEKEENRNHAGIWTRYIGLPRLRELADRYGWSTTHHGTTYRALTALSPGARLQVYDLSPFEQAGFETRWCFSIPNDDVNPEIYAEIQALNRFHTVRRQGDKRPNELPLDEPMQLRFFRPTSAGAGPNVSGTPRTLAEMKEQVDQTFAIKGLLIFDFGAIVTAPSLAYTGSEVTLVQEAQALIAYADSLGFTFLTFEDLCAPDLHYRPAVSINHDYVAVNKDQPVELALLANDLSAAPDSLRLNTLGLAQHGALTVSQDRKRALYAPAANFVGRDAFYYVAASGDLIDTAWVFVAVANSLEVKDGQVPATFRLQQNHPNPFSAATVISYQLFLPAVVEIQVFNARGQAVANLANERQSAGSYRFSFAAPQLSAGVYFYRMRLNGNVVASQKMVYLKERF